MSHKVFAEISRSAIQHNFAVAKQLAPHSKIMPAIKADAYGHGLIETAKLLPEADAFAVARIQEAELLRTEGIRDPIVILSGSQTHEELKLCQENEYTAVITSLNSFEQLQSLDTPCKFWLKFDTGMHRLGIELHQASQVLKTVLSSQSLLASCEGIMSHFASSETKDDGLNSKQIKAFQDISTLAPDLPKSLCNSGGIFNFPEQHYEWVRPGIMLYGCHPLPSDPQGKKLKPVMSLKAEVLSLRDVKKGETVGYNGTWEADKASQVATISIGYGDGYPRHAPNGTPVSINGKKYPLCGRVSMDLITVDVSGGNIKSGDIAELWGENLPVAEVAEWVKTNTYELLTRVAHRVPRVLAV